MNEDNTEKSEYINTKNKRKLIFIIIWAAVFLLILLEMVNIINLNQSQEVVSYQKIEFYLLMGVYANAATSIIYVGILAIKKKDGWKEGIINNVGYIIISILIYHIFLGSMVVFL